MKPGMATLSGGGGVGGLLLRQANEWTTAGGNWKQFPSAPTFALSSLSLAFLYTCSCSNTEHIVKGLTRILGSGKKRMPTVVS